MEYDNDTLRRRTTRLEIFCWLLLLLLRPMADIMTLFTHDLPGGLFLLLTSCIVFPLYLLYSRLIDTVFPSRRSRLKAALISALTFLLIPVIVFLLYAVVLTDRTLIHRVYFSLSTLSLVHECWWVAVNMCLTIGILFVRKAGEEKSRLESLQKERNFFTVEHS